MSPDPDRDPKRTRKTSSEGMPTEGAFGPKDEKVELNKKLTFEQVQLTPGKPGPSKMETGENTRQES
eukprot:5499198-Karenia_brevis.AAC.1